jgi:hypothetical protein
MLYKVDEEHWQAQVTKLRGHMDKQAAHRGSREVR